MRSESSSPPASLALDLALETRARPWTRNVSLDYLRATALVMMCLVHMWQRMLRWAGPDVAFLIVGEAAPCLFFVAFGMTQHLLVQRSGARKREYLLVLAAIGLLHCYFMTLYVSWEFFSFLWASAVVVLIGHSLRMGRRGFLLLAGGAALLNVVVPLGTCALVKIELADPFINSPGTDAAIAFASRLWIQPGPFYLLPWGILVFFGFALGLDYPRRRRGAVLWAMAILLAVALVRALAGAMPGLEVSHHLALSKWGATSTYIATGAAATILLLVAFGALHTISLVQRLAYPAVRFLSDHLLEGAVFHYLIVAVLTLPSWGWTGGGMLPRAPNSTIVFASILNLTMLVVGLKAAVLFWTLLSRALGLHEINANRMAGAALVWLALLHVSHVTELLGYLSLRWLAFSGMLVLALAYGDVRSRRRAATALAT